MIKSLLILVMVWLNPSPPYEVIDDVTLVLKTTLAQCEAIQRETLSAWSEPQAGLFIWVWCVETAN